MNLNRLEALARQALDFADQHAYVIRLAVEAVSDADGALMSIATATDANGAETSVTVAAPRRGV